MYTCSDSCMDQSVAVFVPHIHHTCMYMYLYHYDISFDGNKVCTYTCTYIYTKLMCEWCPDQPDLSLSALVAVWMV